MARPTCLHTRATVRQVARSTNQGLAGSNLAGRASQKKGLQSSRASLASGFAERENALAMLAELPGTKVRTLGADKAYDTAEFVAAARKIEVTPHVAQHLTRHGGSSAIDARTTSAPRCYRDQRVTPSVHPPPIGQPHWFPARTRFASPQFP